MDITGARANASLSATAGVTSTGVTGSVEIGAGNNFITLTDITSAYSVSALVASGNFVIDLTDNDTTGSTAFVAGTQQVETATAAGTVTLAGNATITVTAAGMTGSPKAISVAVALSDTPTLWAAKVRTALAADTAVSALFDVSGSTTAIVLTRKETSLGLRFANDSTLNIAIANGTSTGITAAPTSTNTTAGVVSSGSSITDGDGKDFEGVAIVTLTTLKGLSIKCTAGGFAYTSTGGRAGLIEEGDTHLFVSNNDLTGYLDTFTFTVSTSGRLTLTVLGGISV